MNEFNPYAPPEAEIVPRNLVLSGKSDLWRDDNLLVIRKGAELPDRCLKCDEPAEGYRLRRSLSWHPPGWYLLILVTLILYIIVALCVRWTAKIAAPFCPRHRAQRRNAILFGWLGALAGIGLIIFGVSSPDYAVSILVGVGLFLLSLIFGVVFSQLLVPKRIDANFIWLKKVGPKFLADLPEWQAEG